MAKASSWATERLAEATPPQRGQAKQHGVHYTPPELALFLARQIFDVLPEGGSSVSVLDPACGDGELLEAVADVAPGRVSSFVGCDRDKEALDLASKRLADSDVPTEFVRTDFLEGLCLDGSQQELFGDQIEHGLGQERKFDVVISNPPYVRTQVLGASTSRQMAQRFGLSGRVDLYHAFALAMSSFLRDEGVLGLLCSNRFLSTQGGAALRDFLWNEFELCRIFDLGDTKLFSAAVLPAIVIGRKKHGEKSQSCRFARVYENRSSKKTEATGRYASVLDALEDGGEGFVEVDNTQYKIDQGQLQSLGSPFEPWIVQMDETSWLSTVESNTAMRFGEAGNIRVGIKTTADRVFIRDDWDELPEDCRPESELLFPLLTHENADKWNCAGESGKRVLYPHAAKNGRRSNVDLSAFPRASAYLELHRERLSSRKYVAQAGREWFEIWVPQNPVDWPRAKIVFPDISETPKFFLDRSGAVVNGDCYWIPFDDEDEDLALLMLGIANSELATRFYDAVCANRLYAGRRRFITQYVNRFPLPKLSSSASRPIVSLVRQLVDLESDSIQEQHELEADLNIMVDRAFGLVEEGSRKR
jgi:adenine-specific DNA-methyltransferase